MTFADLVTGDAVFVDTNTLTYHFEPHARWGSACTQLFRQIESNDADFDRVPGLTRYAPV
jgi:hypothetical protein